MLSRPDRYIHDQFDSSSRWGEAHAEPKRFLGLVFVGRGSKEMIRARQEPRPTR